MIINDLPTLKINKLTQRQFDNASMRGELEEQALYLTLDEGNNIVSFMGNLNVDGENLSVTIQTSYFEFTKILEDKNIPRLLLVFNKDEETREILEFNLFKYDNNSLTFISTTLKGIITVKINNFDEIEVIEHPYMHAEKEQVDSGSETSDLLITEGAVWRSLNNFNTIYTIYCNITEVDGAYTSITLGNNSEKNLPTILSEAAYAYNTSKSIVLADPNKEIYLQNLTAVESTEDNSYRFIFNASESNIYIKNIIQLDSSGFTCYNIKIQPELIIENSLKNSENPIASSVVLSSLGSVREEVIAIAQGKCQTYTFDNKAALASWIQTATNEEIENLHVGDVFLLRSVGEPDYWWEPAATARVLTEYAEDDIVVSGRGAARILETTKVDIQRIEENYAHKENDLDNIKIRKALKYSTSNSSKPDGTIEYDTINKKIYIWTGGSRGPSQEPQSNVLYLIIEE